MLQPRVSKEYFVYIVVITITINWELVLIGKICLFFPSRAMCYSFWQTFSSMGLYFSQWGCPNYLIWTFNCNNLYTSPGNLCTIEFRIFLFMSLSMTKIGEPIIFSFLFLIKYCLQQFSHDVHARSGQCFYWCPLYYL